VERVDVDLARRGYEAFNRGDMDAVLDLLDTDVEVRESEEVPDAGVHHKHAGFLANLGEWEAVLGRVHLEPQEFVVSGDRLLVMVRVSGRGQASGATFEQLQAHVWTVRAGKAVRLEFFADRAEAERAAGIRSE
jgi:ketosteroid isomerase-like protein